MRILLTGVTGQLGRELLGFLSVRGDVICIGRRRPSFQVSDWRECDFGDEVVIDALLDGIEPDIIINAAAYTAVDLAESEPDLAYAMNARLPGQLAQWCKAHSACLIHFSTDYVFDGDKGDAYLESDITNPQTVYGKSKLAGEQVIMLSNCQHVIIRTSWVYSSHGKNFVLSMLNLARKGIDLKIVNDQVGSPTSAKCLASATDHVLESWLSPGTAIKSGIYHFRDDGVMSWYGFAAEIFRLALKSGLLDEAPEMLPIPSSEFPQAAKRPEYSVLDCRKINRDFHIQLAPFQSALQNVIDELAES